MTIEFNVEGQIITRTDDNVPVADSVGYIDFSFSFSDEWTGVAKTAVITLGSSVPYYVLIENDSISAENLPVFTQGEWNIGVFGGDLITSNVAPLMFVASGLRNGRTPAAPPEDIYNQIVALATSAKELAEAVKAMADNGDFDGADGEASAEYIAIGEQVASDALAVSADKTTVAGYKNDVISARDTILTSVSLAEGYKNTATTQAGIATVQANIALAQAAIATAKANIATDKLADVTEKAVVVASNTDMVVLRANEVAENANNVAEQAAEVADDAREASDALTVISALKTSVESDKNAIAINTATVNQKTATVIAKASEVSGNADIVAADKTIVAQDKATVIAKALEALNSAAAALISEQNAKISEDNAFESAESAGESETVASQALSDLLAMLGSDVATLTNGKLTPSQIPDLSINDVFEVADTDEMLLLTAERGDVALIVPDDVVADSYILSADDPSILANWKKLGVSYVANAGHATTAGTAENADKINNHRLVTMTESQYAAAVLEDNTLYAVYPDEV